MISETKYLIDFLDTHISHKLTTFDKTRFSNSSKELLKQLFNNMIIGEKDIPDIKYSDFDDLKTGEYYHLMQNKVKQHIDGIERKGRHYSFKINKRNINVFMISEKNQPFKNNYYKKSIAKIYKWLKLASIYSTNDDCSQNLNIYLYFTDLKKIIPQENDPIDENNANTAFTFSCKYNNEIYIYRKEEWFKVLIHECFHSLHIDFSSINCHDVHAKLLKLFRVNADVSLYETYCEVWAELLNIMFICVWSRTNDDVEKMIKKTEKMVNYERMFSIYQSVKILLSQGLSYNDLISDSGITRRMRYKEKTPVLSYYILKSIILYNINDFVEWCFENNGSTINFNKENLGVIKNGMEKYFDFIREHYKGESYLNCIDEIEEWFHKNHKRIKDNRLEINTMRMTVYEFP